MLEVISLKINRKSVRVKVEGEKKLLWVLRGDLGLTGPKYRCGEGMCEARTVPVNEKAVRSRRSTAPSLQRGLW
jgi:aerobic-type carbon monoxide dehydrogenase small subunit (CoxS/CutS family)